MINFHEDSTTEVPPGDAAAVDHSVWDKLLKTYVTEDGWVDYKGLKKSAAAELKGYINTLGKVSLDQLKTDTDKKSFWINAYNAVCVQTLLDSDLPEEVPHARLFGKNIFTQRTYTIAGKVRSLDDIEHGIIRKELKDPRAHAALVCGASSCPRLRPEAFTAKDLDRQLDEEARRWIQAGKTKKGERKNYLDRKSKVFHASKIFDWFNEDFGGSDRGVLDFIQKYASDEDRAFLQQNKVSLEYLTYHWNLNSQ